MPVVRITPSTYVIEPVEFSYRALDDEILVEKSFSKIVGNVDKALVMPVSEKTTSLYYLPFVKVVVSEDVESGCVLPESWIESVEEYTINEYGMPIVNKKEIPISEHVSRMFRKASAIMLKTELNFLYDRAGVNKQKRFYSTLYEQMHHRYWIM